MKDSGLSWLGVVPETWEIVRMGQLYTERKQKVSDVDYQPLSVTMKGVLPQLSTAAKSDAHDDRKLVCKGDFAINSRSDRRGSCGISPCDGSVSLINTILTPRGEISPVYYEWLFHSTMFSDEFYKWGHGIVNDLWTTNWQDMKKISVPLPTFDEQCRISAYLNIKCSQIDSIIEKTGTSIEEYKKLKQAIITQLVTKGIHPNTSMNDSGKERIGEIPADWEIINAHRIINSTQNGLTRRDLEQSAGQIVLKLKNISPNGTIDYSTVNRINLSEDELSKYALQEGDFLFVRVNGSKALVGKCAIFTNVNETVAYNDHIIRVRLNSLINKKYFQFFLLSNIGRAEIDLRTSTAAGQFTISGEGLRDITVVLPPLEEQKEIVQFLEEKCGEIDHLIERKDKTIEELESFKKSLIFECVTGKKEVPA